MIAAVGAAVRTLLVADAAVSALVVARIHADVLPQAPPGAAFPAVVLTTWPRGTVRDADGPSGLERHSLQVDAYATTRASADAVLAAVSSCLCPRTPTVGHHRRIASGVEIQGVFEEGGDGRPTFEDETKLYRRSVDFEVWAALAA